LRPFQHLSQARAAVQLARVSTQAVPTVRCFSQLVKLVHPLLVFGQPLAQQGPFADERLMG
jgi:hypothetical protein